MKLIQLGLFGTILFTMVCCGLSPEAACKEIIKATCQKYVECVLPKLPEVAKKLTPIKDQETCETDLLKKANCDNPSTTCKDGKKYSATQALKCVNEYKAITCSDYSGGSVVKSKVPSCQTVCQ